MFSRRQARRAGAATTTPWGDQSAIDLFSYEMLLSREAEEHAHMWQTPALALTAQAFLLTISLDTGQHWFARCIASGLGVVLAFMSVQLMAKHRFHMLLDREMLKQIETRLGMTPVSQRSWAPSPQHPSTRLNRLRSYALWRTGLLVILLVNAVVFGWALTDAPWDWSIDVG